KVIQTMQHVAELRFALRTCGATVGWFLAATDENPECRYKRKCNDEVGLRPGCFGDGSLNFSSPRHCDTIHAEGAFFVAAVPRGVFVVHRRSFIVFSPNRRW